MGKQSNAKLFSYLGFCLSLAGLIQSLVIVNFVRGRSILEASIFFGAALALLAFVFSIIGLVSAVRVQSVRWPGISGIVISVLYLPLIFMAASFVSYREASSLELPGPGSEQSETVRYAAVLTVDDTAVSCVDNSGRAASKTFHTDSQSFDSDMAQWLTESGADADAAIQIAASANTDFADIQPLFGALERAGFRRYALHTFRKSN